MSDNDDLSSDEEVNGDPPGVWIPYAERELWKDVVPIEQDDGPNPIVAIAYTPKCKCTLRSFCFT